MNTLIQLTRAVTAAARPEDKTLLQHVHACNTESCDQPECATGKRMLSHFTKCRDDTCSWCLIPRAMLALDQEKLTPQEYNHAIDAHKALHFARVAWMNCPEADVEEKQELYLLFRAADLETVRVSRLVYAAVNLTY